MTSHPQRLARRVITHGPSHHSATTQREVVQVARSRTRDRCRRHSASIIALVALVALMIAGCGLPTYTPQPTPISTFDTDYSDIRWTLCTGIHPTTSPHVGTAASSGLVPLAQSIDARIARFRVPAPAKTEAVVAGTAARGTFLLVQVQVQYIGDIKRGLSTSLWDYQLVNGAGQILCVLEKRSEGLNIDNPIDRTPTNYQMPPGEPPRTIWLVYDLDPSLVQGSYLRAYNMAGDQYALLDIGLS